MKTAIANISRTVGRSRKLAQVGQPCDGTAKNPIFRVGMTTGTIKFFSASKGFGFVTPDGGGADIFLPAAAVTTSGLVAVSPGQRVTFEHAPDKKGPKVITLQLLGETVAKAPA